MGVGVESSHEGTKLAPAAAKHLGPAQFDAIPSLGLVHRIFTAAPEIKFRGCLPKGPKDFKPPDAGPPDTWRKICHHWQQGEPLSLDDTWKAMSDGRYIAYVPETAGLVGLDLDKGDFESAEQRIAAEFPHAIRVKSVSGRAYHVLFAAPRDRSQELPPKFALFGGEGIVRYDKGYLCFNSDPYLEALADAVEMAAKGILPELPLDRIMLDGSARGAGPRRRSSQSNQRRRRPIESMTKMLQGISPGCDRDVWLRVGMGIHDETRGSDSGYELFEQWSSGDLWPSGRPANYAGPEDTRKAWDSFELREDEARTTFGTVVALANEAGRAELPDVARGSPTNSTRSVPSPPGPTSRPDAWAPAVPSGKRGTTQFAFSQQYWEAHPDHLFDKGTGHWWAFEEGKGWYRPNAELLMRAIIETNVPVTENRPSVHKLITVKSSLELASHMLRTPEGHRWDYSPGVVGFENGMAWDLKEGNCRAAEKNGVSDPAAAMSPGRAK